MRVGHLRCDEERWLGIVPGWASSWDCVRAQVALLTWNQHTLFVGVSTAEDRPECHPPCRSAREPPGRRHQSATSRSG
eukprot:1949707-Prymnesium_polylepis.1